MISLVWVSDHKFVFSIIFLFQMNKYLYGKFVLSHL